MSVERFIEACTNEGLSTGPADDCALAPALCLSIHREHWGNAAAAAKAQGLRWAALWTRELAGRELGAVPAEIEAFCCLAAEGRYVVLRTQFPSSEKLPSHASIYAAADRPERHAHDLLGVHFENQPDARRWTRHLAWSEKEFPLRRAFPVDAPRAPTPPDDRYPFVPAHGASVVEIPVGPVHAGIIEPGHFRFQAVGEAVLNLEQHLGYVHKGIEKIAVGRDGMGLVRLAGRVSGDSTVAHAWAACQAIERALGVEVPRRALALRAIMAERERVANHLGDIGAICNDVGFSFAQYQLTRLKEEWVRASLAAFGHRFMMDCVVPGGVVADIGPERAREIEEHATKLAVEVASIIERIEASESLEDRLMTTGRLTPEQAAALGVVGYVGRASGQAFDVRRDAPYAPYDGLALNVPSYRAGDVAARAKVRADEIQTSLRLTRELAGALPEGPTRVECSAVGRETEGIGFVDGWRGEIVTYVHLDADGRVTRFFPRDPSWLTWPALELLVQGNIVPDFPVCNKSVNGSYSGQDL
jgi:Ni,Fe-hydrogenase III large subunit/NADH:ubiquinone oxidoreductase subunit C